MKENASSVLNVYPIKFQKPLLPEETESLEISEVIVEKLNKNGLEIENKDILVITSKTASLFEGRTFELSTVNPSMKARFFAKIFKKNPREMQLIFDEGKPLIVIPFKRVVKNKKLWSRLLELSIDHKGTEEALEISRFVFIVNKHAAFLDDAGLDFSNAREGYVTMIPPSPCITAKKIRESVKKFTGKDVAVVITDTVSLLGRMGSQDVAIGYSGIDPITRKSGSADIFGKHYLGGNDCVIDSLAGISGMMMGQTTEMTPMTLIRGYDYADEKGNNEKCMEMIAYPKGTSFRSGFLSIVTTIWYHFLNVITFWMPSR
ncbi:MAG: coenzyme F420-0:L-glutamate ligase [Thermotogota bacterium]|nr:coenzyme F420-0:L-glutamate ligase [Thermotogota bacterium]